jgi:hypothetical protein
MARKEEFVIIVSSDGQIKVEAVGFRGKECVKALKDVGQVVSPGTLPIKEEKFPEYYQQEETEKKVTGETKEK